MKHFKGIEDSSQSWIKLLEFLLAVVPGPGDEVLFGDAVKAIGGGARTELHHAFPKYLGGAEKQELVPLFKWMHQEYHKGLDLLAGRWRGAKYYENLPPAAKAEMLRDLANYTKNFDAKYGTKLYDALLKNGFPKL
jgi:hypothetical protein